ncbi:MAG TPA: UDP-N-acetylmuramyl-tripeptide synthetase, partial [Thermomicrobiales bacterium]|nr:UDP-N-acetylmuramyl-tripeptide synthetase [Thermomicrobiales bacterium]
MTASGLPVVALASAVPDARLLGLGESVVSGVAYDSRLVQPGYLFAALRGADLDGHTFIQDAERRGAGALLVEVAAPTPLPQIVVNNSRAALAAVSAAFFGHPSQALGVIGITGTDGKTTTSYLVDHILHASGVKTGMVGTVAIRIGGHEELHPTRQTTPESNEIQRYLRQMADAAVEWAILEATSHGLAMHRLDHVRFKIGAVTKITHEHLDYHGTVESYRRAKGILLERVASESGVVVVNADDPGSRAVERLAEGASIIRYSSHGADADLRAENVQSNALGSLFELDAGSLGRVEIRLPLIGEFNIANAVCATGIAIAADISLPEIVAALGTAPPIPGRMARVEA